VEGRFHEQDAVLLCDPSGYELGRGLVNFTSEELEAGKVHGHPGTPCCGPAPRVGTLPPRVGTLPVAYEHLPEHS
jgi:hypothetical protein